MIGEVTNLAIWEWFKLRRRWLLWLLLGVAVIFATLDVVGSLFSYRHVQEMGAEVFVRTAQGRNLNLSCNDLLSGDPARQPSDVDPQVVASVRTQCQRLAPDIPRRVQTAYAPHRLLRLVGPGLSSTALVVGIVALVAVVAHQIMLLTRVLSFEQQVVPGSIAILVVGAWLVMTAYLARSTGKFPRAMPMSILAVPYFGYPLWAFWIGRRFAQLGQP